MKEIVSDYLLHLYGDLRKAHKSASSKDIQCLSDKVYQASVHHEKRLAQLQAEQVRITRYYDLIWKEFMLILEPIWKVEEELLPLFDELKFIYRDLDVVRHKLIRSPESIQSLQNRLNEFENRFRSNGIYSVKADQGGRHLEGQAVINGILEECYKISRSMILQEPEVDQNLMEIKEKLIHTSAELDMILRISESDKSIDLDRIEALQNTLDLIDSQLKDGKFLDENGNPPKGQAYLRSLLEASYDRVNDILLNLESNQKDVETYDTIKDVISHVQEFSKDTVLMSKSKIEEMANLISDSLLHPKDTMKSVSSKFLSLTRSGVSMLSRAYLQLEPISDELKPISEKLNSIKTSLLEKRNEINKGVTSGIRASMKELVVLQSELDQIDRSRINGKFVNDKINNGQYHLSSLLNECYCLLYELTNRVLV